MDFLTAHAQRQPDEPAIFFDGEVLSYRDVEMRSNQLANAMRGLGIAHHHKCTTVGYNSAEHMVIGAANRKLVTVSLPMNYRLSRAEVEYQLQHSQTSIVFCGPEHVERVRQIQDACPELRHRVAWGCDSVPEGWHRYDDLVAAGDPGPPEVEAGLTGPSMTYTAGTTGNPKGAYRAEGMDPETLGNYVRWFDMSPTDVHLAAGPLYHSAPGAFAAFPLILGGSTVVMPRFDAESALALIDRHHCTSTFMAPTLLQRIVALPLEVQRRYDLSSMRVIVVAAAPCPFEVKRSVMKLFGEVLYEFYGSSELGCNTVMRPEEQLERPGSCGRPVEGMEMRVLDDDGAELPAGQPGELFIKSPQVITEYYRNADATESARSGDYFTVGDVGYFDEDGYLYIVDRKRDMIISGGVNVCTTEVENVLHAHPDIWDVAIVGIPSEEWGEAVHAIIQPRLGRDLDAETLVEWLGDRMADYKRPRSFEFRETLPRDEAGKIRKRDLREPFWQGHDKRV